jgi:hypothetical protein
MVTSHYVWVVRAFSRREGWVRLFNQFPDSETAWTAVVFFWNMMVLAGDYSTIEAIRTISFIRK